MRSQPETPKTADFGQLEGRAWRSLLAAAARAAEPSELRIPGSFGAATRYGAAPSAPAAVQPLLELYAPLCGAQAGRPLALAHLGQSLDGCIATASGDSYYVTGPDNVRHLHRLRALSAADRRRRRHRRARRPAAHRAARRGAEPRSRRARSVAPSSMRGTACSPTVPRRRSSCTPKAVDAPAPGNAEVLHVPVEAGRLRLDVLLERLHERGWWSVFVEGGGETVSRFLEAGLARSLAHRDRAARDGPRPPGAHAAGARPHRRLPAPGAPRVHDGRRRAVRLRFALPPRQPRPRRAAR